MLRQIQISNFKCIDQAKIKLRPLTILCGPNSSGKSTLSQALLLLKQSYVSIGGFHTLSPKGNILDLGSYSDMIRNHDTDNLISYKLDIDSTSEYLWRILFRYRYDKDLPRRRVSSFHCEFDYKYLSDEEKIVLDRISIRNSSSLLLESRKNRTGTYRFVYGYDIPGRKLKWSNPNVKSLTDFLSPQPVREMLFDEKLSSFKSEKLFRFRRILHTYLAALSREIEVLNYLGPFRQTPNRYYMTGGAMPSDIGYKGESSVDYISYLKMSEEKKIIDSIRYWLRRLNYANDFDVTTIKSFIKSVQLSDNSTKIESSLVDVGFGISQVLPVIIAVLRHKQGVHIFEQPEIHLHPSSQADIADLFIENKSPSTLYIIETHSEHFLNRIRRRVAEGVLGSEEIAIYYIFHDMDGYHLHQIKIDEDGSFIDTPESFFDEYYQESKKIIRATLKKG